MCEENLIDIILTAPISPEKCPKFSRDQTEFYPIILYRVSQYPLFSIMKYQIFNNSELGHLRVIWHESLMHDKWYCFSCNRNLHSDIYLRSCLIDVRRKILVCQFGYRKGFTWGGRQSHRWRLLQSLKIFLRSNDFQQFPFWIFAKFQ